MQVDHVLTHQSAFGLQERSIKYGFVITVPELANTIEGGGVGLWSTTQRFMADHPVHAGCLRKDALRMHV